MRFLQGWPESQVIVTLICIVSSYHNAKGPLLEYLADREYFVEERPEIEEKEIQTPLAFNWLIKRHRMIKITVSNDPNVLFREKYEYREPLCKILLWKVSCKKILYENKIVITLLCITILVMFDEKGFTKSVHWSCSFELSCQKLTSFIVKMLSTTLVYSTLPMPLVFARFSSSPFFQ